MNKSFDRGSVKRAQIWFDLSEKGYQLAAQLVEIRPKYFTFAELLSESDCLLFALKKSKILMKNLVIVAIAAFALTLTARAGEASAKITDVHLCCQSCVKGVKKAVEGVEGVTASANQDEGTVTLTGADRASVQKAADALVAAGYYGKSSDVKLNGETGATGKNVKSLEVENVHLCCGKCVKAVNTALGEVKGVAGNTAAKGVKSFTVNGDFNDKEVFTALQKNGLTGQAGK